MSRFLGLVFLFGVLLASATEMTSIKNIKNKLKPKTPKIIFSLDPETTKITKIPTKTLKILNKTLNITTNINLEGLQTLEASYQEPSLVFLQTFRLD